MAVTTTPRLGLTRWSAPTDPFTRAQMDASHAALETNAATLADLNGYATTKALSDATAPLATTASLSNYATTKALSDATAPLATSADLTTATTTAVLNSATDLDTLTTRSGLFYLVATGNTHTPPGLDQFVAVEVQRLTASALVQHAYPLTNPRARWHRFNSGTGWSAWSLVGLSDLGPATKALSLAGYGITNLADPVNDTDAISKGWAMANMGAWSARTVIALNAGYAKAATFTGNIPLAYSTQENGKLVRINGHFVTATSTSSGMAIATLPSGAYSAVAPISATVLYPSYNGSAAYAVYPPGCTMVYATSDVTPTMTLTSSFGVASFVASANGSLTYTGTTALSNGFCYYIDFTYRLP